MTNKIYVGVIGLKITDRTQIDLTGYTSLKYKYQKPDDTEGEFVLTVENLACGVVYYNTQSANDLDQVGDWTFQVEAILPTFEGLSDSFILKVNAPFT